MKKRKIMFLLFILIIVMLISLLCLLKIPKTPESIDIVSDSLEVINQGDSVVKYDEKIYLVDTINNKILEYDNTNNQINDITKGSFEKIEDRLYIVRNRLLYTADDVSYSYNFQTKESKKIFDGTLEFADEDLYFYTQDIEGLEYLYVSNYDEKNMEASSNYRYNLAYGKDIYFLRRQGSIFLFGSINSSNISTLFCVDTDKQKCQVLIDKCLAENTEQRVCITDAYITDEYYYYILANICESSVGDFVESYDLYERSVHDSEGYPMFINVGRRFNMLKDDINKLVIRTNDYLDETYIWIAISGMNVDNVDKVNLIQGNVKDLFDVDDDKVMYDGQIIGKLSSSNWWISNAMYIGNNFYLLIAKNDIANWYVYDGVNNFKRIY